MLASPGAGDSASPKTAHEPLASARTRTLDVLTPELWASGAACMTPLGTAVRGLTVRSRVTRLKNVSLIVDGYSWADILRILLVGAASYTTLVAILRLSGKRTLGQLNVFDFVVTVALGSTLATIFLSTDVS